jgi:hypothetical protein
MLSRRNHRFGTVHMEFPLTSSVVCVGCRIGAGRHIAIICKSIDSMNKEIGRNIHENIVFTKQQLSSCGSSICSFHTIHCRQYHSRWKVQNCLFMSSDYSYRFWCVMCSGIINISWPRKMDIFLAKINSLWLR